MSSMLLRHSEMPLDEAIMAVTAEWARLRSKDPSTKVGACVYDPVSGGTFMGYNGFPPGLPDESALWESRDPEKGLTKYDFVVHAEMNAVRKVWQAGIDAGRCTLYCTHEICPRCAVDAVAMSGIRRVIVRSGPPLASISDRARKIRDMVFAHASVRYLELP